MELIFEKIEGGRIYLGAALDEDDNSLIQLVRLWEPKAYLARIFGWYNFGDEAVMPKPSS